MSQNVVAFSYALKQLILVFPAKGIDLLQDAINSEPLI